MSTEFNQPLFTGPLIPGDTLHSSAYFTKDVTIVGTLRTADIITTGTLTVSGNVSFADGNLTATTAGVSTMSGGTVSATTSTLGVFGTSPVVQATTANATTAVVVFAAGTTVTDNTTFNGYTVGQVVTALQSYGILA